MEIIFKEEDIRQAAKQFAESMGENTVFAFYGKMGYDMGCEEYFYSGHPCFIEWPELIEEVLPEETVSVTIEALPDGLRRLVF